MNSMKTYLVLTERKRVPRKLSIAIWEFTNNPDRYVKLINNDIVVDKFRAGLSTETRQYIKGEVSKHVPETEFNIVHISATDIAYFDNFEVSKK